MKAANSWNPTPGQPKDKPSAKRRRAYPSLAAPQVTIPPGITPGDNFNAGGHPTLNTKPLFKLMVEKKASDLFFTSNAPIKIKIEGQILPVNKQVLTPETVRQTSFALFMVGRAARTLRSGIRALFRHLRTGTGPLPRERDHAARLLPRW